MVYIPRNSRLPRTNCVTQPQPFKSNLVNASYLIASSLPSSFTLPSEDGSVERRISLHVHPTPIPVSYATVREAIPAILKEYTDNHDGRRPDLIIHIGIAAPRLYYSVESLAHRDDYNITDIEGRSGYEDGEKRWREMGLPPILKPGPVDNENASTSFSSPYPPDDRFLKQWKAFAPPNLDIRISHDAGHYLCDFIYYTSLSLAYRENQNRGVVFLHVPGASEQADIKRGHEVAIALIKSMVTCWIDERNPSV